MTHRRSSRRVLVDALSGFLKERGWAAAELADESGVSKATVERALAGGYIRQSNAAELQAAVDKYDGPVVLEGPAVPRARVPLTAADRSLPPLQQLYAACDRVPAAIKGQIRVWDFKPLIEERTRAFVGREWLFNEVDRFLAAEANGYLFVRGLPGVGKTSFAAAAAKRWGCPHHFNSRFTGVNRAEHFLASVCGQLIARVGSRYDRLPDGSARDAGHNPLRLPVLLPRGCYLVLTGRPDDVPFRAESPSRTLYLDQSSADNLADVRRYLAARAKQPDLYRAIGRHGLTREQFVDLLADRSRGNFIYLHYVLPEIARGRLASGDLGDLPAGLENYYEAHWSLLRGGDLQAWVDYKLPVLRALASSPVPVSVDLLADRLRPLRPDVVRAVLDADWRQFLEPVQVTVQGRAVTAWRIYHPSFADFLRSKAGDPTERVDLAADRQVWHAYWNGQGVRPD